MEKVVVTLKFEDKQADLALPATVPLHALVPILEESLNWPLHSSDGAKKEVIGRVAATNIIVRPHETLAQADVAAGDVLELNLVSMSSPVTPPPQVDTKNRSISGPRFVSAESGAVFAVHGRSMIIGRSATHPISLGHLPTGSFTSGKHANVVQGADGYRIMDLQSTNGTFVDGYQLQGHETILLREGSRIQFGKGGPVLIFHTGRSN